MAESSSADLIPAPKSPTGRGGAGGGSGSSGRLFGFGARRAQSDSISAPAAAAASSSAASLGLPDETAAAATTTTNNNDIAAAAAAPSSSVRSSSSANNNNNTTTTSLRESLRRNSMNTMNFLRSVMGQRNQDYVSDVQMHGSTRPHATGAVRTAAAGGGGAAYTAGNLNNNNMTAILEPTNSAESAGSSAGGFWNRLFGCAACCACCRRRPGASCCCGCCCRPRLHNHHHRGSGGPSAVATQRRKHTLAKMLNTRAWKIVLVGFTVILLIGAQVRTLFVPKQADPAVDAIFTVAFCFFWLDILFRMDAEVNYFHFYVCGVVAYSSGLLMGTNNHPAANAAARNNNATSSSTITAADRKRQRQQQQIGQGYALPGCCGYTSTQAFRVGSFLFFCDLVSTVVLLREISFLFQRNFDLEWVDITLDEHGLLEDIAGSVNVNRASPVEFKSVDLLAIIGKTARIARFIRSSTAVKISSRVNWFFLLNLFNPFMWLGKCWDRIRCRRRRRGSGGGGGNNNNKSTASAAGGGGDTTAGGGGGGGGGASEAASVPTEITTHDKVLRTWGSIVLGAKAQSRMQSGRPQSVRGFIGRTLNMIGIQTVGDKEELRRHVAATKIQRAWRKVHSRGYESGSDDVIDVAWKGRGIANNAMDRELQKRSFMIRKTGIKMTSKMASFGASPRDESETRKRRNESQVGTAMRELSGQRVAMGIIVALCVTVLFTYTENNTTRPSTMIVLHSQTAIDNFSDRSLDAARSSSVPDLYSYTKANGELKWFDLTGDEEPDKLRDREKIKIVVKDAMGTNTTGYFAYRNERREEALVSLLSTIFVLLVWFFGVTSFAGPVMILVVVPIERMVRLLGMLMLDPLGYQGTSRYKRFEAEGAEITKNTHWTEEVLKGMETSFLMDTILRIGSLMKVGFGSAGVEIIRSNLQKGQTKNQLMLSSQGSTVSCIFLFSDIRQFTDATECLQEEVFVFTNKIAAVVHSICHSYGGSANKNIGDAFLLSWLLEENADQGDSGYGGEVEAFTAKDNQADKALLSVVKICIALHHDDYYVSTMTEAAKSALLSKLSKRKGPIVQMGFGLHAGKAVQGAIGSTRKIDATYVSEAVERAEFLESSTKKYGLQMLMSDSFHRLLHPNNRRRCRKIDQIIIRSDDDDESDEGFPEGDIVELLTYDMDIDALWKEGKAIKATNMSSRSEQGRESDSDLGSEKGSKREGLRMPSSMRQVSGVMMKANRRRSLKFGKDGASDEFMSDGNFLAPGGNNAQAEATEVDGGGPAELVLPTGPALYNASVWTNDDMRKMRQRYTDGLFFHNFNAGLQSFYAKDWDHAKQSFITILDRFEDGPSRYFLNQIEKNNGKPPRGFLGYGLE